MKYFILFISLFFRLTPLSAQNVEFSGLLNRNTYFDYTRDEGHFRSTYKTNNGFAFSFSAEDTIIKSLFLRLTLTLENYNGSIDVHDGGLGSSSGTEADVKKTVLGINIYPLNFKIGKMAWINIGPSINYLLHIKMNGQHSFWRGTSTGIQSETIDLKTNGYDYTTRFNYGLNVRIAPEININKRWALLPQYLVHFGISREFRNVEANIISVRQYLGLGIIKRLTQGNKNRQ